MTIKSADNLLYLESPNNVVGVAKGTAEYDAVMNKLMETNYAHQAGKKEDGVEVSVESASSDEESEEEVTVQIAKRKMTVEEIRKLSVRRESRMIAKEIRKNSKLTPA